mgnify:CR=1 FL=1
MSISVKRVLFLIHDLCHGGAEKVLVNLVNNMSPEKFDITVQTLFDVGVHRDKLKPHVHYKACFRHMLRGNSHFMKLFSPGLLYRALIREEYDIVISYLEGPPARIISGCPYPSPKVCWLHIELNDEKAVASGFRSYQEAVRCYQKYDQLVAVSETVKQTFCGSSGIQPDQIRVLYNTNETNQIQELAKLPVDDVVFEKDVLSICSVAKITPTKGYDRLARVHKRLMEEDLKHHIYILGVGEQQEEIEAYLRANHLENSFTFLGFRDNPYKYVAKCDLYVCSSLREGFSTAVTEALIVGTPVVSTLCSGAKELLGENDEYGVVVENSEEGIYQGMKRMLLEPELLRHYTSQARQRGQYFSTENTVAAVAEMLESLSRKKDRF